MTAAEPLVIAPVFQERLWGGTTLREWFGDAVPDGVIGECWAISGLAGSSGEVLGGPGAGGTLREAWRAGLIAGGPREDEFPILVKLLDAADWLSVQVHPNDEQARELEGQDRGKAECWYVVQAAPGAELIIGHSAPTAEILRAEFSSGELDTSLLRHRVSRGSFFMVPAGCVHAIGPGLLIYEVQQSSDLTYRLYDFDRIGLDGRPRELHVDKGFGVVTAPFDPDQAFTAEEPEDVTWASMRTLVHGEHFAVREVKVMASCRVGSEHAFELLTVLDGAGALRCGDTRVDLQRGTSVVLPVGCTGTVTGVMLIIVTTQS